MRQVKSNIFNGDSYKAIFARAIYKRLMSREWVTLAEIMSDYLGEPCENPSKEEHYGELKKAFGKIKVLIIEKVGKDSIEVEGNNRSQRFRYMGDVENPLSDLYNYGRVIRDLKTYWQFCQDSAGFFPESWLEYFFKECQDKDWFNEAGVSYEKQLITLINIIELTFREINNHVNSTENKKINKNATDLLFKTDAIFNYMFANGEDAVKKMYTLIDDISDIDPSYKALARNKILEKYPDFKFRVSEEKKQQSVGLIVTAKKLAEKKAEVDEIQNVLIPKNAAEVADAKAKGDLKENQEYKSAKEEQHFLNLKLTNLQNELNRAVVFDPTTSTTAIISFGTVVSLKDNQTGNEETYTILGPWESDPDNNVISYMAPFGDAILNKKVGDILQFTINEHKYDYTVKNISKAKDI